jgi:3-oxosteroid 1-dehydrogenase
MKEVMALTTDARQTQDTVDVDLLVVGSGCGGLVAALTAAEAGLDVLVVEKADVFGGSTVYSGGSIWIPNAPEIVRRGTRFPPADVIAYLEAITEGRVPRDRIERYVHEGPAMLALLERLGPHLRFEWRAHYPDYHPSAPGGSAVGRSIEVLPLDRRELGTDDAKMTRPPLKMPRGMWIGSDDLHAFLGLRRSWRGKAMFLRLLGRVLRGRVTGAEIVTRGEALCGRLFLALRDAGVPLWLSSPLESLTTDEDGGVVGATILRDGRSVAARARHGVVLATGGFDHNREMRAKHHPLVPRDWSMGAPSNTGDGIQAGEAVGAATDLMDDAWWMPGLELSSTRVGTLLFERQIPGQFIVNGAGRRYTNEAGPYTDFVHDMLDGERAGISHIPSWLIIDDRSWRTSMFAGHLPLPRVPAPVPVGHALPKAWVDSGVVKKADTWPALAAAIGVPERALGETVERFNAFARAGRDEDFHRGESVYDNYYGDPRLPNPNLHPVDQPPYYAFKLVPGDLGTKGGLVTDADARVLRPDGSVIAGLYATGNTSASVMGTSYAGPGGSIGPAMTFAYVAVQDVIRRARAARSSSAIASGATST